MFQDRVVNTFGEKFAISYLPDKKKPELSGFLLVLYAVGAIDLWGRTSRLWCVKTLQNL